MHGMVARDMADQFNGWSLRKKKCLLQDAMSNDCGIYMMVNVLRHLKGVDFRRKIDTSKMRCKILKQIQEGKLIKRKCKKIIYLNIFSAITPNESSKKRPSDNAEDDVHDVPCKRVCRDGRD